MDNWTLDNGCLISCILLCKYIVFKEIKKMGSTFINFQEWSMIPSMFGIYKTRTTLVFALR